jgi:hypothetical protein
MGISEWTNRHNRWSDLEVKEVFLKDAEERVAPDAFGNPAEKKRFQRGLYMRMPLFFRPFGLVLYRLFLCGGVLDGKEGFIFWILQTFWFRFLIDAKLFETQQMQSKGVVGS